MIDADLSCRKEERRDAVRAASLFGLDYAEVSDDQRTVYVYFLGKAPKQIEKANIRLQGGQRIRDVQVVNLLVHRQTDPTLDDYMEVAVNKPGDFSTYTLSVVKLDDHGNPTSQPADGFDSRYDAVDVSFKAACPTGLDCKPQNVCPPPQRTQPEINYLAKDYASFRQLILDRLALVMPRWQETHVPDLGIALVEILAYVGDYLSYYQDAVATEAYLNTARQRISVRRHVRLVDYAMHDGCNARAWVTVDSEANPPGTSIPLDLKQVYFITRFPGVPPRNILTNNDLVNVPASSFDVFQPLRPASGTFWIYQAHSKISFYTWGDSQCCLAKGATRATLIDQWLPPPLPSSTGTPPATAASPPSDGPPGTVRALNLNVGDVVIFEEVIGPGTGDPADADPTHRQAVRLTCVKRAVDPLYHPDKPDFGQPIVEIEWAPEDAPSFTLCISVQGPPPACDCLENVTVVRGNVILVDNGGATGESLGTVPTDSTAEGCATECAPAETTINPGLFRPTLSQQPLTFGQPLPACGSASALIAQDPRQALPQISLSSVAPAPGCPSVPAPAPPCQVPPLFTFDDLADPTGLAKRLKQLSDLASQYLYAQLSAKTKQELAAYDGTSPLPATLRADLVADLNALLETWTPVRDLLESGPDDRSFVVEMDDDGYGHIRFGDGSLGRMPDAGTAFRASYRTENGTSGNVGAEKIAYIVLQVTESGVNLVPRNPLPATGGTDPEPVSDVKLFAPTAFRDVLERAITALDYTTLAADNARRLEERSQLIAALMANGTTAQTNDICYLPFEGLQGAKATLRWTGSWYTALVAIDPLGTEGAAPELLQEITAYLEPYRRIGHDLLVSQAEYVALDLAILVCVLPKYLRAHVESALLDVFSNRVLPDGTKGFFHPDNLTFGEGIFVSKIVAAAQAVTGVQNVRVTRLERFEVVEPAPGETDADELPTGSVLTLGPLEIARLDNDPDFPENGRLSLDMRGGR
ncbi:MAG: putative baseplate assembly protein [Isosphaerales bacterium]